MHIETLGSGAPLVLLHGWGMHGGVWTDVARQLAEDFCVHVVDLPGHGKSVLPSPASGGGELDAVVAELSAAFPSPLTLCGWSLGGQVALHWAARAPDKVRRLILVASTPCFAGRGDWAYGMESAVLEKFAAELEADHAATLRRFIALQLRGSENERELLALMRERLSSRGEPDMAALRGGLNILRDADQRAELAGIKQPTLVIAGERDKLTPPEASRYMTQAIPSARLVEVAGAAHAPFLSHPEIFVAAINAFLKGDPQISQIDTD
ncbi:MAG: pimeloyl-[acyl-carrier protein] methyl ester esterase [Gallionellaceae bacterium]|nr:MAG: pimeloyl-[acyl-carrier protein] methyl ester esterase [Gallionellaceae bacterium]